MTTNIMKQLSAKSSIFGWMDILISRKRQAGKDATADLYRATRNWLWKYSNGRDIPVRQVSPPVVDSFVCYLRGLNFLRANTINSYLSGFRAMYNQIICEIGYRPRFLPFGHVVIRLEKTVKRAVRLDVLENVTKLDLQHEPDLKLAADLCAFSFMACGIPFVDLAHLTHENIEGNMLIYHRTKTRTLIRMELTQGMRFLLDKYASNGSPYLFPILSEKKVGYERYKALLRKYNNNLKELGRRLGITVPPYFVCDPAHMGNGSTSASYSDCTYQPGIGAYVRKNDSLLCRSTGPIRIEQSERDNYKNNRSINIEAGIPLIMI